MKKTIIGVAALTAGCASVPHEQSAIMDDEFIDRLVESCQTNDPLALRARITTVQAADAGYDTQALLKYIPTCHGLTTEQQLGYWYLITVAARERQHAYDMMIRQQQQRQGAALHHAGRTMMEIERTQDLSKIRRNSY